VVVTDRTVLDAQLQATISGFDHTLGAVETIGEDKTSKDLRDALNNGVRIIVTTLQKFPVIYQEVDAAKGRNYKWKSEKPCQSALSAWRKFRQKR
jgi:type I restriction enzyme R subunit